MYNIIARLQIFLELFGSNQLYAVLCFQVDVFLHAARIRTANESLELWLVRMTVLNSIVDPWLYIVLRPESLHKISKLCQCCFSREKYNVNDDRERLTNYADDTGSPEITRNTPVKYSSISDR